MGWLVKYSVWLITHGTFVLKVDFRSVVRLWFRRQRLVGIISVAVADTKTWIFFAIWFRVKCEHSSQRRS